ncbi:troponin T, skeletal muscle [Rhipicephalus sanguineus]|uniref:troponin T, skeletal muscle n=1 Tax=Rhipicephalus sanguineus TaxID=34632 RepID=UPI0020C5AE0F|nr:troponin T, skeletal muscle [Rhipicephalus sanguineus]
MLGEWSPAEDVHLLEVIKKHNTRKWAFIATKMTSRTDHMIKERYQRLCRTFGTSDIDELKTLAESRKKTRCSPRQTTQQRRLAILKEVDEMAKDKDPNMTAAQKCDWLYEHLLSHNLVEINDDEMSSETKKSRKNRKRARAKSPRQAVNKRKKSMHVEEHWESTPPMDTSRSKARECLAVNNGSFLLAPCYEAAEKAIQSSLWVEHGELNDEQEIEGHNSGDEQEEVDEETDVWEEMEVEEEEVEETDGKEEEVGDEETDEEEEEAEDEDMEEENEGCEKEEHDQWRCAVLEAIKKKGTEPMYYWSGAVLRNDDGACEPGHMEDDRQRLLLFLQQNEKERGES